MIGFSSIEYIFKEQTETTITPRRTRDYIEWKSETTHLKQPTYIIEKMFSTSTMSNWFDLTDRWTVTVASSVRRRIRQSDIHQNTTQMKDVVNCRDQISFWNTQMIEDFHVDRTVSRWLLVETTCVSVRYMEMGTGKQSCGCSVASRVKVG